jgi:hypothetical protein
MAVRNHLGSLDGYVGVTEEHPLFEVSHTDVLSLRVHCGLDGAGFVEDMERWWFVFCCSHDGDLVPGMLETHFGTTYRSLGYVSLECEELASQIAEWGEADDTEGETT